MTEAEAQTSQRRAKPPLQTVPPGRHDPEGRRRQIIRAAAELIPEVGTAKVTHRLVAQRAGVSLGSTTRYFASLDELIGSALEELAAEIDDDLEMLDGMIAREGCEPDVIARHVHEFLTDAESVRVNIEMYHAAITDSSLQVLAMRWSEGLQQLLAEHVGSDAAYGVVAVIDGASVHAALSGEPVEFDVLRRVIAGVLALPE